MNLVGKIVLFSGTGIGSSKLEKLIHVKWNSIFKNLPSSQPIQFPNTNNEKFSGCVRIYPDSYSQGLMSLNYDPIPFLHAGASFVSLNISTDDQHFREYENIFATSSFILKSNM